MRTLESKEQFAIKNICCIGAGYVGGPTCAVIADRCKTVCVTVVDKSESKISSWLSDNLPIYEPGLLEIVKRCRNNNLFFSTDIEKSINDADLIFISVDTPSQEVSNSKGKAIDLTNLENVARMISKIAKTSKIVVEKSTVPVKAAEHIKQILSDNCKINSEPHHVVISNPEFLAEGSAIQDLLSPDRILIGVDETCESGIRALESLKWIYNHWVSLDKLIVMSTWSSELSKLAANAFLAQRISSINSLSAICELTGADIRQVADAIGRDKRIGPHFLNASIGFGGSCFQKDVLHLVYLSESLQLPEVASYWKSVIDLNNFQKQRSCSRICQALLNDVKGKRISIWGFAFKKDTRDTRESPAISTCQILLEKGAHLAIFDPRVDKEQIYSDLNSSNRNHIEVSVSEIESAKNSHAIVICTEWDQFRNVDFKRVFDNMHHPALVFDGRLVLNHRYLKSIGFLVEGVGLNLSKVTDDLTNNACSQVSNHMNSITSSL